MSEVQAPGNLSLGKILKFLVVCVLVLGGAAAVFAWYAFFSPNTKFVEEDRAILIPNDADFSFVKQTLAFDEALENSWTFELTAQLLKYDQYVKPGRYEIPAGQSNWDLVRKLRSGAQDPVSLRFRSNPQIAIVATEIAGQLGFSSDELMALLQDEEFLAQNGTNSAAVAEWLIPNTYFVYYTVSPEDFLLKMKSQYEAFWTADRKAKAKALDLSPHEVMTLASIVQAESYMVDERPTIAGVYLNRLRKGIRLQADPTVIFANQDFSIRRVLNSHLEFDSPYNTYLYAGLPPGPINNPEPSAIDAVLNYENHKYIYFCARSDFSGYHHFSKTLSEHNRYAQEYRTKLSELERKKRQQGSK